MEVTQRQSAPRWTITRDSFAALLLKLGSNPFESGVRYEALRSRLMLYFSRKCLDFPEELADDVLDRLTRRLADGTEVGSIEGFALGIARHVALEQAKKPFQLQVLEDDFFANIPAASSTPSEEERLEGMERCLACLPAADVELLTRYYVGDGGSLIGARKDIAEKLGVSPAAVRQRVFFLRRRLQKCMEQYAARAER